MTDEITTEEIKNNARKIVIRSCKECPFRWINVPGFAYQTCMETKASLQDLQIIHHLCPLELNESPPKIVTHVIHRCDFLHIDCRGGCDVCEWAINLESDLKKADLQLERNSSERESNEEK